MIRRFLFYFGVAAIAFTLAARVVHASELDVSGNELSDDLDFGDSDQVFDDVQFPELSDDFSAAAPELSDDLMVDYDYLVDLLSAYGSNPGIISEPYLTYIRSCLSWCTVNDKYVAFVSSYTYGNSSYTYYLCAIGDISYDGTTFSGQDVSVYQFFPNANAYGNYRFRIQPTFSYTPGPYGSTSLCFTDISSDFPDIRGQSTKYIYVILCIFALVIVFYTITKFGFGNVHIRRRSKPL